MDMENITVLVLLGGDSKRFWPLPDKHSLNILGKPLIYWRLKQFERYGFKEFVVVVNKYSERTVNNILSEFPKLSFKLARQVDPRGMAGAVVSAKEYITGRKILIISPSDIFEDVLLDDFKRIAEKESDGIIAGVKRDNYFPGGYLTVSEGKVKGIVEKPKRSLLPSNIITFVFDFFRNADSLLSSIRQANSDRDDLYEEAINRLIKKGSKFIYLPYEGFWGHLKYPWHALSVCSYFLNKINKQEIKKSSLAKSAVISGKVIIEDGVKILENAKIVGPSYIGTGTIIGNNAIVRQSMIGANCVVGYGTEIARSYIDDYCWFHSNYIGDSIVSANVSMGAGTVLANFKLSESGVKSKVGKEKLETGKLKLGAMIGRNVRIGVNCSIMPGVKIGKNSLISAHVLLDRDLKDSKFCKAAQQIDVVDMKSPPSSALLREKQKNLLNI